jgi:hypothetical protein
VCFKLLCQVCLVLLVSQTCMAGQKSGMIPTACENPPFAFDFSEITDTCKIKQCVKDTDIVFGVSYALSAPGGIVDLGMSDTNFLKRTLVVPDTGYKTSASFTHLHLYAIKTHEGNYALFLEGTNIYGGCFWFKFYWAYNDNGSREFGTPSGVIRQKAAAQATSGMAGDGIKCVVDTRGRSVTGQSKTCGIKLYVDKAGRVLKKVNPQP